MNESIQCLVKSKDKKRKVKASATTTKKSVSKKARTKSSAPGVEPDLVQVSAQVNAFQQAQNISMGQGLSLGSVLDDVWSYSSSNLYI